MTTESNLNSEELPAPGFDNPQRSQTTSSRRILAFIPGATLAMFAIVNDPFLWFILGALAPVMFVLFVIQLLEGAERLFGRRNREWREPRSRRILKFNAVGSLAMYAIVNEGLSGELLEFTLLGGAGHEYYSHNCFFLAVLAPVLYALSLVQFLEGVDRLFRRRPREGYLVVLTAPIFGVIVHFSLRGLSTYCPHGRPLRVRGGQLLPRLRKGSEWTRGRKPDASELPEPARLALEALWLQDARAEHASVPAFARLSWLLAAVGAPANLVEWSHRAALEEIEHARLCFALAAGYGGRSHSVEPMPELLRGASLECRDAIATLAIESVKDGCLLEDFNADVASACAEVCEEPVTRAVLEQLAREERSHAEFSWAVLAWLLEHDATRVRPVVASALEELAACSRPHAVSGPTLRLVAAADEALLRVHGRIGDDHWNRIWDDRVASTRKRGDNLINERIAA